METETRAMGAERAGEERVTPLELFFDLVFVLSFTQVTLKMAENPGWASLGEGLLILAAVWWAWCAYGWLTNSIDPDQNLNRVCIFSAMGGMLVVSLSIPDAFGDRGVLFGCAYFLVRAMQLILYVRNNPEAAEEGDLQAILRLAPGFLLGSALLIVAGLLDGGAQASVWILAILIDWATPLFFGTEEFHLEPAHFAERHGLIVMIALGESILAIGAAAGFTLSTGQVVAALCGIAVVAALWWAYFDVVAIVAERRLNEAPAGEQAPLARDAYSYLHFPLIAGIVLLALGLKETLAGTGETLETVPALALCGGPAVYLLGQVAFRERVLGSFSPASRLRRGCPAGPHSSRPRRRRAGRARRGGRRARDPDRLRSGPFPRGARPGAREPLGHAGGDARLAQSRCQGVRIRGPSGVIATVNSKCAASESSCE